MALMRCVSHVRKKLVYSVPSVTSSVSVRHESISWSLVPGQSLGHTDPPPRDPCTVSLGAGVLSIQSVSVDDKCVERRIAGQPDLLERPVLHEHPLQVGFAALLVQISDVKPVAVIVGSGS